MPNIRLVVLNGKLEFPHGGLDFNWKRAKDAPSMLMHVYPAGDMDTIPWPMKAEHRARLARALYDERETNEYFRPDTVIELPDGTVFDFDNILAENDNA